MPANECPADLILTFAHDLRQPLRSIVMQAQRLQRKAEPIIDDEAKAKIEEIIAAAKRQEELIAAMVEYDQAGHDGLSLSTLVPLKAAVQTACMKVENYRKQCDGVVRFDPSTVPLDPAPAGVSRILEKLLHNALKFRQPDAAPEVTIEVTDDSLSGELVIAIEDRGIGIDAQYRELVFTPFRKLNPSHQYPGSGLGLATCRRLLASIGGTIWIDDLPDTRTGTCVKVRLGPAA